MDDGRQAGKERHKRRTEIIWIRNNQRIPIVSNLSNPPIIMRFISVVVAVVASAVGFAAAQGGIECPVTPNCDLICSNQCEAPAGIRCSCPLMT